MDGEERKLDSEEVKHLADQAKELKDDPAFVAAVLALRKQWFNELMTSFNRDQSLFLTMKLQALEAIPQQLQVFINNHTWAEKRKH